MHIHYLDLTEMLQIQYIIAAYRIKVYNSVGKKCCLWTAPYENLVVCYQLTYFHNANVYIRMATETIMELGAFFAYSLFFVY